MQNPPSSPLDVIGSPNGNDLIVASQIYEMLFKATPTGAQPWLAEKAEASADGLTWTVTLKTGIKFHDGTDFDAAAVKANFDLRMKSKTFRGNPNISELKTVNVVDPKTVQFILSKPKATLLQVFAMVLFAMQSPAAMAKFPNTLDYQRNAAGTGPFKLGSGAPGDSVFTFVRNDQYWGPKAYLDKVIVRVIEDDSARLAALEAGDVQFIQFVPAAEVDRLTRDAKIDVLAGAALPQGLWVNTAKLPTNDKRVRQAIAYGLNPKAYLSVYGAAGELSDSLIAPADVGYSKMTPYPYDPAKAKQLLTDAGIQPGAPIDIIVFSSPDRTAVSQLIQQDLDKLGFKTTIRVLAQTAWFAEAAAPADQAKWNATMLGYIDPYPDAEATLLRLFFSTAAQNYMHYSNPRVDQLLVQQAAELNPAARGKILAEIQTILWDELPMISLLRVKQINGSAKTVHDVTDRLVPTTTRFDRAWLDK